MDIPAGTHLGRVNIRMRIDPDHRHVAIQSLADGPGGARDGTHGDGVVAAQREHHLAFPGVLVHLPAQLLGDRADGPWLLHASVIWVVQRRAVLIVVDDVVIVKFIVQVVAQLVEEAGFNQGLGGSFDADFALVSASQFLFASR